MNSTQVTTRQIEDLQIVSKNQHYDHGLLPAISLQPETYENISLMKASKPDDMSQFSWIIQQGLQNARKQSQQQKVSNQILQAYTRNINELISQTNEMQTLTKLQILKLEEQEMEQKSQRLLQQVLQIKERMKQLSRSRKILHLYDISSPKRKKSQVQYYVTNKKTPITENKEKIKKRSISTHRKTSVSSKQVQFKQKQLLFTRIAIIKDSIDVIRASNIQKQQKLILQNQILREQIKLKEEDIGDFKYKSKKNENSHHAANSNGFSRNRKDRKERSVKARKSSVWARLRSQSHFKLTNTTKKIRIKSSNEKPDRRQVPMTARQQYFQRRTPQKMTDQATLIKAEYY